MHWNSKLGASAVARARSAAQHRNSKLGVSAVASARSAAQRMGSEPGVIFTAMARARSAGIHRGEAEIPIQAGPGEANIVIQAGPGLEPQRRLIHASALGGDGPGTREGLDVAVHALALR